MIRAILENSFLQFSFLAAFLASISGGIVGSYIVLKRMAFLTGCIAHSILGGLGFFLWLSYRFPSLAWLDPLYGAFLGAIISAFIMGYVHIKFKEKEDTILASIWSAGMALGVIFISLIPGQTPELMNFLFGNILWIEAKDLWFLGILDLLIIFLVSVFYYRFLSLCFDEEQAKLRGLAVTRLYFLLLVFISVTIVLFIQIIGIILVLALLTIPPTIARKYTQKFSHMIGVSVILNLIFNWAGLSISYYGNTPPGATIALIAVFGYFLNFLLLGKQKKKILISTKQK